ncbi:MAG: metallophosphoesterase family protein [Candidatus Aenigmarchaeota archaeon]|nr:metallophosphoesterase family protein [Candidatus Aenigmarchaeota archaeon]
MKISVLSDLHFGHGYNSELENDSFDNGEEAVEKSLDSDLIILAGDVFDIRAPKTPTWGRALKILSKPLLKDNPGIKLVETDKQLKEISQRTLNHIPLIAIHGNHERLTKGEVNTVEALENAGLVIYLHLNKITFEKDGKKVAIHAMSSVPDRYAKEVMDKWDPKPVQGCVNILVIHQGIDPYVFSPIESPTLSVSNLPRGFDIIINGHLHGNTLEKIDDTILMMPGSTVVTQMEKSEAGNDKVIGQITIDNTVNAQLVPLQTARKFYYEDIELDNTNIREQVERKINQILYSTDHQKKPLIKLKIRGKNMNVIDSDLRVIEKKYFDRAILILVKDIESDELSQKTEFLRNLRQQKISVEDMGLTILKSNLDSLDYDSNFDYDTMFKLLSDDQVENAFNILTGDQTTLSKW